MRTLKRILACMLVMLLSSAIVSCGFGGSSNAAGNSITFWAAPNPPQVAFWTAMAKAYMDSQHGIQINVTAMPESPTSEAGIQGALAGGAAPQLPKASLRGLLICWCRTRLLSHTTRCRVGMT